MSSDWTSGIPALSSVASSWLKTRNSWLPILPRRAPAEREPGQPAPALQGEDEEALFLEFPAQPGFAVGDVDAFDDLAAWRAEPTAKFHGDSVA